MTNLEKVKKKLLELDKVSAVNNEGDRLVVYVEDIDPNLYSKIHEIAGNTPVRIARSGKFLPA
jgi:hypothetical protein